MKIQELFESEKSLSSVDLAASEHNFKKSIKYTDGKDDKGRIKVIVFSKNVEVEDYNVAFKYTVNSETSSWNFSAIYNGQTIKEDTGEDLSSLIKHMSKKNKISKKWIDKFANN